MFHIFTTLDYSVLYAYMLEAWQERPGGPFTYAVHSTPVSFRTWEWEGGRQKAVWTMCDRRPSTTIYEGPEAVTAWSCLHLLKQHDGQEVGPPEWFEPLYEAARENAVTCRHCDEGFVSEYQGEAPWGGRVYVACEHCGGLGIVPIKAPIEKETPCTAS